MLPTTGLVGGCGIGLSLLVEAIWELSPAYRPSLRGALETKQSMPLARKDGLLRYARNDDAAPHPNRLLRHSISLALTSSGFSCCVQWPLSPTRYFSRSGTSFSMPSAAEGGRTASFSAMIIREGTRTV